MWCTFSFLIAGKVDVSIFRVKASTICFARYVLPEHGKPDRMMSYVSGQIAACVAVLTLCSLTGIL